MGSLRDRMPGYLLGRHQLTSTVVFTALFALVFILASVPFSHNVWFNLDFSKAFALTVIFIVLAAVLVIVSKSVMYRWRADVGFTVLRYVVWNVLEIVSVSLLYTVSTVVGDRIGVIAIGDDNVFSIFGSALLFNTIALGVPYVVSALYFMVLEKDNTIRLMNFDKVVSDDLPKAHEEKRITLFDNNGTLKLSVDSDNLFFIESDDNYIKVWYVDNGGTLRQYMLRCRMKTIEESFAGSDLVRCHRKYIVNIRKVRILKSESEGYRLDLGIDGVEYIPVSRTYEKTVLARFNSIS